MNHSTSNTPRSNKNNSLEGTSNIGNEFDFTPDWFEDYELMLDIVYPQRQETFIFNLDNKRKDGI